MITQRAHCVVSLLFSVEETCSHWGLYLWLFSNPAIQDYRGHSSGEEAYSPG